MDSYRCLGRPLPDAVLEHPRLVEDVCATLLSAVVERRPLVRRSGAGSVEAPLLAGLAVLASRLRRRGLRVTAAGEVFASLHPPPKPSGEVAILLESTFYEDLGEWAETRTSQTVFLVGSGPEWARLGVTADIHFREPATPDTKAIRAAWKRSALDGEIAALATALACDLDAPGAGLVEVHQASTMRSAGWYTSPAGVWLARQELDHLVPAYPELRAAVRELARRGGRFARAVQLWEEASLA